MIQSDVEFLAMCPDEKSHEETSEGVSSVPGSKKAGCLQEAAAYPSQWVNHEMEAFW